MVKALLLLIGLVLLGLGGDGLYRALASREQKIVTCMDYPQARPRSAWLRVTGCEIDYLGAGYRESNGQIEELYFPVRAAGRPRTEPAPLVAATRDPEVLAMAQSTIGEGRQPDQEQFLVMMLKIVTALRASREVEGTLRAGLLDRLSTPRILSGLAAPLAPDVAVIDLHARPSTLAPAIEASIGVLFLLAAAWLVVRSRRPKAAAVPAAATVSPAPADVPAPETRPTPAALVPAARDAIDTGAVSILLLNLDESDGRDRLEHAPPLGPRDPVMRKIADAVPDARFDVRGKAEARIPDGDITIDIGPDDPVVTAVIVARGTAGVEVIRRLLDSTGWRAYSPKTGAFLAADQLPEPRVPAGSAR
jgi:hypothetical protein